MIRTVIVDDEAPARQRLARLLATFPEVVICGEASHGMEALEVIRQNAPDVVFLDIDLPELSGLEVAKAVSQEGCAIVFVTAYDEHALKAFELAATDYLVKPIHPARLADTLRRLQEGSRNKVASSIFEELTQTTTTKRMAIRTGAKLVVIDLKQASAFVAREGGVSVLMAGRELLVDDSLDVLQQRLNPCTFVRVHRSSIINLDFLKELVRQGDRQYVAVLADSFGTRISVSRERLAMLKKSLGIV